MIAGTVIVVDNKFIASHFNLLCIHDAYASKAFLTSAYVGEVVGLLFDLS